MKSIKSATPLSMMLLLGVMLLTAACSSSRKFVKLEGDDVARLVENQSFIFVAERMNPMRASQRNLTSYYDVKVKNDSLRSFLPYYGRAYGGFIDPTRGGLDFLSKKFQYSVSRGARGSYDVTIRPDDVSEVQTLNFSIFDNGTATLNVTSTNRDPISFFGYLQPADNS